MTRVTFALLAMFPVVATAQTWSEGEPWRHAGAGCHVVEKAPSGARADGIPTFPALSGETAERLQAAMNPLHGRMPDLALSKREQDDLAAYIRSLRRD
jgi:hypothetical protein